MFKVGDIIEYCFFSNVEIVEIDSDYYYLKDKVGNIKPVYKYLVEKYGILVS